MAELNTTSISSGEYKDMIQSVNSTINNRILLDNISKIYNYDGIIELPMSFLRKYENILKTGLMEYTLPTNFYYRPEYLSYYLFGTTDLWYLILFVNDMKDPLEFCTEKVWIPNTLYVMEIINKLKLIEKDTEDSQENPIQVKRHFLKDINFSSDKVIDSDNSFIHKNPYNFEDSTEDFVTDNGKPRTFHAIKYEPTQNYALTTNNRKIYASNNISFPIYLYYNSNSKRLYSPISIPTDNESIKSKSLEFTNNIYNKYFEIDSNYILLNRYNGQGVFNITNSNQTNPSKNLNKLISSKNINFKTVILSYDLREGSLSPEFLKQNLCLNFEDTKYYPELAIIDGKEQFVITINSESYPIYFDGFKYFIEYYNLRKPNDKTIIELENDYENNDNIYHSMNEWEFNSEENKVIIDEDKFFLEKFNKGFGNYVYTNLFNKKDEKNFKSILKMRINLPRDIETNKIDINKYKFLGFNFFYKANVDDNLKFDAKFSPLKIEIVTNEIDENGNNISYFYTLPCFDDFNKGFYDTGEKVSNIKRIIPIIHSCKTKENIDIKDIYVYYYYEMKKNDAFNYISIGGVEIYGFTYDEIVSEFALPQELNDDYYSIEYEYSYNPLDKGFYFEPFIFKLTDDLMESTSDNDENNDLEKKTNYLRTEVEEIPFKKDAVTGLYYIDIGKIKDTDVNSINYIEYTLNNFNFDDNFKLTFRLDFHSPVNNIRDFNSTINSTSILFNMQNKETAYMLNLGEERILFGNKNEETDEIEYSTEILNELNHNSFKYFKDINGDENSVSNHSVTEIINNEKQYSNIQKTNSYWLLPDGIYKLFSNGNENYQIFKDIQDLNLKVYTIMQNKDFSEYFYEEFKQKCYEYIKNRDEKMNYSIFFKIIKKRNNIIIQFKFNEKDDFMDYYNFGDYTNILQNGSFGLRTYCLNCGFNNIIDSGSKLSIIKYEIETT